MTETATILVVEDDAIIAHDIQCTLQRLGYRVPRSEMSGQKALRAVEELRPDLVLMDIQLRGTLDGIDTATLIRKAVDVPIVFLTSHSDEATLTRAKSTGPHGYLLKPFAERDLRITIDFAIHKHATGLKLKKLEERLALSEHLASIGTLAAGVAHEINNPLSAVAGNVGLAADVLRELRGKLGRFPGTEALGRELEGVVEGLDDAGAAADRIGVVTRSLKRFGRGEKRAARALDLRDVLDAALKMSADVVSRHAVARCAYGTTPHVEPNEGQLVQVFLNLVLNAAQSMATGNASTNEVHISTGTDSAGRAVVEVRDTGCGIAKENLGRIFDPFYTTRAVGDGTGLGLSVCHSIVASLGGEITVESELGRGSMFRVALPAAEPGEAVEPGGAEPRRISKPSA